MRFLTILTAAALSATGCSKKPVDEGPPPRITYTEEREPCEEYDHLRRAYFGDLHSHTGYSFDAVSYGNHHSPSEAYAFARGAPTGLPPIDADGEYERTVSLARPLDFAMVSDHAEFLGEVGVCMTPGSDGYDHETCQWLRDTPEDAVVAFGIQTASNDPARIVDCAGDLGCVEDLALERWQMLQEAAEENYDRTAACGFVTFVGYEYTNTFQVSNNHRVVVFRNADVPPLPTTYYEAMTPPELWAELADQCLDAGTACDVVSIPHNMNLSNGRMFVPDPGDDRDAASLRARLEPVVEIYQQKGDMECRNGFDGLPGDPDPLCDFEKQWPLDAEDCGEGTGSGGMRLWGCVSRYDFVRNIFKLGLQEEARLGVNPYRMGVIAATDTHNAIPGMVAEDDYHGHVGIVDDTPEERLSTGTVTHDRLINNPGGLAGVWAEERSRDAIFGAMRRGETFATSGPRIQVRVFGGWEYPEDLCADAGWIEEGYDGGAPMGGDLPPMPGAEAVPRFVVWAQADPLGAPLQHLQVVKGWIDADGEAHERVFDVAGDPGSPASVDTDTCTPSGSGQEVLCTVWTDETFDPDQRAFWYVRVLQNPTCRWSTWECIGLDPADRPAVCDEPDLVRVVQERAWSSPVWYSPAP